MKKYVDNTTRSPMYVGNTMIPPGEGKLVDVPDEAAPAAAPAGPSIAELTDEMLKGTLKELIPQLPDLNNAALDLMEERERLGQQPRKGLLDAIGTERMRRADAKLQEIDAAKALAALEGAQADLAAAEQSLAGLPGDADDAAREAAQQAVTDAQVKVTALTPEA